MRIWPTEWPKLYASDMSEARQYVQVEKHPWPPFVPAGAELIFLGTFPPPGNRWGMDFFYPNRISGR